jgi:hypothetical protein
MNDDDSGEHHYYGDGCGHPHRHQILARVEHDYTPTVDTTTPEMIERRADHLLRRWQDWYHDNQIVLAETLPEGASERMVLDAATTAYFRR